MENKQNRNSQTQASSSQSTNNNLQSNQPTSSSSSSSNQSRSQSSGSNSPYNTNSSSNTSSNTSSSKSSLTDKLGGLDMNSVTNKLQEYGNTAMNKVNSLSTTQKVVGGSLLALGAGWLAMNSKNKGKIKNKLNTTRSNKFGRTS